METFNPWKQTYTHSDTDTYKRVLVLGHAMPIMAMIVGTIGLVFLAGLEDINHNLLSSGHKYLVLLLMMCI